MIKCCALVAIFIIYLLILGKCSGIILTNEEKPKPAYTAGIKTTHWRNPNAIQTHHNYSKVYVHNNPGGASEYILAQTEKTERVYPIYNAHTYGQRPDQQRLIETNSQLGHNWTDHGHFASLVGSNIGGNTRNRTIYKRKVQYKTLEIYERCPENSTGQFVYYLSCNQFLNCWKGRGEPQNCAPGTLFNPKSLECDFPDKVECITGPRQNTLHGERAQKSVAQASCPKEFSGLIPNYTDCSKFVSCNNGHHTSMDCPPGTLFDINQNVCDFPYKSTCFSDQYSVSDNRSGSEGGQQQNLHFGQSGQNYHGQSGQYHNQNRHGLIQYGAQEQQQGTHTGGTYYQTTYGQNSHSQICNPETQLCTYSSTLNRPNQPSYDRGQQYGSTHGSGLGYQSHNGQFYQTNYGSTVGGSGARQHAASEQSQSGQTYRGQDGQYYQTHYGSTFGGNRPLSQNTAGGQGQSGQTYQRQDGQYYQTHYGSAVGGSRPPSQNTAGGQSQSGQTYQRQDGQYYQTHYSPTVGGSRPPSQNSAGGQGQSGQTSQRQDGQYYQTHYGSSAGGVGFGAGSTHDQNINSKLDFGQGESSHQSGCSGSSCSTRPTGGTQFSYGSTGCRLGTQNCGQNQYTQTTITGQTNCNPRVQNCGGTNGNTQSTYGQSSGQYCNPRIQNCGGSQQQGTSQVYSSGQSQVAGFGQQNYNKVCNINDPNCHRNQDNGATSTNTRKSKKPKCPDNFQGITKHPTDCKKFLNCANGQTFIQDCAPGTLFNPKLGNCDFPYNVECNSTEEVTDTTDSYDYNGNGQTTLYEHEREYGQNAGHGNIRQETTELPHTQVTYHQGHGTHNHGQSVHRGQVGQHQGQSQRTHSTHGVYIQSQRPGQGYGTYNQGSGNYDQSHSSNNNQDFGNYKPTTPIPIQNNNLGQGHGYGQAVTDTNRGQIGIVTRPVNAQVNQTPRTNNFGDQNLQQSIDYVDVFDPKEQKNYAFRSTTPRSLDKHWPPPFPSTDTNADYVFEYDDGELVTLEPENVFYADKKKKVVCGKGDFYCSAVMCISKTMVCDGHRDCQNGKDEIGCQQYLERFTLRKNSHLDVLEKQRWINVSYTTCALLCIENTKFECRSFNYRKIDRTCFLSDSNIGLSGALRLYYPCDYYELKSATVDCTNLYKCKNDKCITKVQLCDGFDDCGDRQDEQNCKPEDFGYRIRLTGSSEINEGRVEVTAFGKTGYICDDQFGINDANVICRELGFQLGAADIKGNSYYARDVKENNTLYMMDDLNCLGNETSLLNCGFAGWGVHNCRDQEIAGVVCKTPQEKCGKGYWKCDTGNECIPFSFVCDGLFDCTDDSDEGAQHCEAPTEMRLSNGTTNKEGRVEIKHHGIWGTVCDDDFNEDAAKVVCKYFGFRGTAIVKKEAYFGPGEGPIWLDQVACYGNETELQKCMHWNWGEHNCDHGEDVGVICSNEITLVPAQRNSKINNRFESSTFGSTISCGFRKDNQFLENDLIHARVVSGSLAKKGDYPWQAALRVKGKGKSAHWCGAVIISNRWVLSAAHCLEGYAKGAYIIVAGEYNTDEDEGTEQQKYIDDYFIHEKFRKGHKMNNDIALIKVKGNGFLLNDDVQPICLPDEDANYERELNCTISGFGSVKSGTSAYSHNMMAAWIPIHNSETCKMPHVYGTALTEGMVCAGFLDGGVDACDGDSGGPLACLDDGLFTLYGLTSWGQHCGYANKPGVYVKVAHYRKWIDDIIKKHS